MTLVNELISVDALALVRFGLQSAHDPKILNTLRVIDAKLKVDTPSGPCWHRYNHDGYGEDQSGNPYEGSGIGRAWPLLTAERGHYEIAAGNLMGAKELLKTMDRFANNGLLSEQIWDAQDIPEKNLYLGRYSGSAMPLTWKHTEYIKLCASIMDNKVVDIPLQTRERYLQHSSPSAYSVWRFNQPSKTIPAGKNLRIEVMEEALVIWSSDHWATTRQQKTFNPGIGIFVADLKVSDESFTSVSFTFFWSSGNRWEGVDFTVEREQEKQD